MFVCSFQGTCLTDVISHSNTKESFVLGSLIKSFKRNLFFFFNPAAPALPCRLQHSTIGLLGLNHRVRDGYGCFPQRIATGKLVTNLLITKQYNQFPYLFLFLRKEVIQPHLPIRLPCYDFTPVTSPAFGSSLLSVESLTSGITDSHGVTGGVYKTRERIHRSILICDY